jgi:hypothetical protein
MGVRFPATSCGLPDPNRVSRFLSHFLACPRIFPRNKAVVLNPTRGVFFAGRRAGSHGAATTTADGRSSTVKEPPSRPLLARSCEPADCDST